ncbi:MAG: hypothetical protein R3D30_12335 [Hyphomicrobiales bacterium]
MKRSAFAFERQFALSGYLRTGGIMSSYELVNELRESASRQIFSSDPSVQAVSISKSEEKYFLRAVKNRNIPGTRHGEEIRSFEGVDIHYVLSDRDIVPMTHDESGRHPTLHCGLEIQNFDCDNRRNLINSGSGTVGSLGCFVKDRDCRTSILSNNHVLSQLQFGRAGDRINQPGDLRMMSGDEVAIFAEAVPLQTVPTRNQPPVWNVVDAAYATLTGHRPFSQSFLPSRKIKPIEKIAEARFGDPVLKVGAQTGCTFGKVTGISTETYVTHSFGLCWFRKVFEIESTVNGQIFCGEGDSGSAIVDHQGRIFGLLFASNGQQAYACDIEEALRLLDCSLV